LRGFIEIVEIRNLTPKRLKNASTIFFKESKYTQKLIRIPWFYHK